MLNDLNAGGDERKDDAKDQTGDCVLNYFGMVSFLFQHLIFKTYNAI